MIPRFFQRLCNCILHTLVSFLVWCWCTHSDTSMEDIPIAVTPFHQYTLQWRSYITATLWNKGCCKLITVKCTTNLSFKMILY